MSLSSRCAELQSLVSSESLNSLTDYSFISSNDLRDLAGTGTFSPTEYDSKNVQSSGAWIIIAVLTFVIYVCFVINAIWMRRCPQKATGMFECCRLPRGRKHTKILLGIGLFLTTAVFASSIAGAVLVQSNREDGDKAACAMLDFMGRVKNGSLSENWGGTNESMFSYQKVADSLTTDVSAISTTFSVDDTQMNLKKTAYETDLTTLETNKANYNVKSAKTGSTNTVEPTFITDLGPIATAGKHLATLKAEMDTLADVVLTRATKLNTEVPDLKSKVTTYQTAATQAASYYKNFGTSIATASQLVADYITENYDKWVYINTGVMVSFYVCIGISFFMIVAILYHHKFRSQLALQIAYIGWNLLMLLIVINAAFASQIQVLKKRSSEHCDVFNLVASSEAYIDRLANQYQANFPATLKSCFMEDGDTYKAVGFGDAGDQIGLIATYIREAAPYFVDGPRSKEIATQKKIIDLYIQGLVPANSDETNADGTVTNLKLLNSYADSSLTGSKQASLKCTVTKDMWVLNLTNCTTNLFGPAYQPGDYLGKSICLEILSLDSSNIGQRYKDTNFPDCEEEAGDTIATILTRDYDALNAHFEDTRIKFEQLKRFYENNLNYKYNETIKAAATLTQPIQDFNKSIAGLLQYTTTSYDGLLNISNCAFMKPRLISANTHVCNTATNLEKTFICLTFYVCCGAVGCIFIYLYLRKLEGTFRLIRSKEDSGLDDIANTPVPKELQNLDVLDPIGHDQTHDDRILHDDL